MFVTVAAELLYPEAIVRALLGRDPKVRWRKCYDLPGSSCVGA